MNTSPSVADVYASMEYSPAPASPDMANSWLDQHQRNFHLFIDGEFVPSQSGTSFATQNPATAETLAHIARAGTRDVDAAVHAARNAQAAWQQASGSIRASYLRAIAKEMHKHAQLFALLDVLENGKPIREAREGDVPLAIRHFEYHTGWAQLLSQAFDGYEACGVVGQIIPWNFPLLMLAWKIAPALAAGNTVVLKPAEDTSLSALLFAEICQKAGLPKGVVNILTGDEKTGAMIAGHRGIDKLAFTGSTEVGRSLRKSTAGSGISISLALGGKSPIIIFEDADIDSAIESVVKAIWSNQGEICSACSRLLLQEGIAERFITKLKTRMDKLRVGNPLDNNTDMGSLINAAQYKKVMHYLSTGASEGAEIYQSPCVAPATGYYVPPTLITCASQNSALMQEEIFGPVLVATTFRSADEAAELANNNRYGLGASVWSENSSRALEVASKLACGTVWINSTQLFDAACGFGGYKESGYGREGGKEGMYAYLHPVFLKNLPVYNTSREIDTSTSNEATHRLVEAACKAAGWSKTHAKHRSQRLYALADAISEKRDMLTRLGIEPQEIDVSTERLCYYAAWADKYDGAVHSAPLRAITLATHEPMGVAAAICPNERPLLGMVSLIAPLVAMGNTVVVVPSDNYASIAAEIEHALHHANIPSGVITLANGSASQHIATLAAHDSVQALWYFGSDSNGSAIVEELSAGNLKHTFCNHGRQRDWFSPAQAEGHEFLQRATQIKNIWLPYGDTSGGSGNY